MITRRTVRASRPAGAVGIPPVPDDPPLSEAGLRRFTGYGMKAAFDAVYADLCRTLAAFDLHARTFSVLVLVVDNPGARRSKLAEVMRIDRGKLVAILAELERRGLVSSVVSQGGRPIRATHPTAAGVRLCARAVRAVEAHEARVTSILNETELGSLTRSLRLIERAAKGVLEGARS